MIAGAFSAVLLAWASAESARRWGWHAGSRFWIAIAAAVLQIGAIAHLLSFANLLQPAPWLGLQAALLLALRPRIPRVPLGAAAAWLKERTLDELACLSLAAALVGASGITYALSPIWIGDETSSHATRVIYWIQNGNLFHFSTHDDRQTVPPYLPEMFFLWPVLLTSTEAVGRVVHWLGAPLACAGLGVLMGRLGVPFRVTAPVLLLYAAAPIVAWHAYYMKPDLWSVVFVTGFAYFLVSRDDSPRALALAGLFLSFACAVRLTSAVLAAGLVFVVWNRKKDLAGVAVGLASGAFASGLAFTLVQNMAWFGHPFGPEPFRLYHGADHTVKAIRVHLARTLLLFLEPTPTGVGSLRSAVATAGRWMADLLGATNPLRWEVDPMAFPGIYGYRLPPYPVRFGPGGLLVLAFLPLLFRRRPPLVLWLGFLSLFAAVLSVRWMALSSMPERFLTAAYALILAGGFAAAGSLVQKPWLRAGVLALAFWQLYTPLQTAVSSLLHVSRGPAPPSKLDLSYAPVLAHLPAGSRILFFGATASGEYPLFGAREGYTRTVVPAGRTFEPAACDRLLVRHEITHVLLVNGFVLHRTWDDSIAAAGVLEWLRSKHPEFHPEPIPGTEHILFTRSQRR